MMGVSKETSFIRSHRDSGQVYGLFVLSDLLFYESASEDVPVNANCFTLINLLEFTLPF